MIKSSSKANATRLPVGRSRLNSVKPPDSSSPVTNLSTAAWNPESVDRSSTRHIGPSDQKQKDIVEYLFGLADVRLNGHRPWDIQVRDPRMYRRVLSGGSLGLGESYVAGYWDCQALDQLFERILRANLDQKVKVAKHLRWPLLKAKIFNLQKRSRAYDVGMRHYDIGNDLYESMLDPKMIYSCAYWKTADHLDQAQEAKLDLICRKLEFQPGMTVLDIGCGWGGFARFAAENYGVAVTGITVSKEQVNYAQKICRGLPVEVRLQDYRDLDAEYDRVVSVGMLEHVGCKNYKTFMQTVHRCLTPDGLFLLHTIGNNRSATSTDPWIDRYIFPNAVLPSANQITVAAESRFVLEDWHSFGAHYDKTLMAWHSNFVTHWPRIKDKYGPAFYRMWTYYLLSCAGSYRAGRNQLWQIVFSKSAVPGGYRSIR